MNDDLYAAFFCPTCDCELRWGNHEEWCYGNGLVDYELLKRYVLRRDDWACRYCDRRWPKVRLHVDHVWPRSRGGKDVPWNLVTACAGCNLAKGARIFGWLKAFQRERSDWEAARLEAYLQDLVEEAA